MINCYGILGQGAFWMINKALAKKTSRDAALLISDLLSKREYFIINGDITLESGWFFNTQENIELDTDLTPHEQRKCINQLVDAGVLEVKKFGLPAKNYFKINDIQLSKILTTGHENFKRQEAKNFNDIYNKNKEKKIKNKNLLIGEREEDSLNFLNDFNKELEPSIEKRESLNPKNKKKENKTPSFAAPLYDLASEIVSAWNEFGISKQSSVPFAYLSKIETLFIIEGNNVSDYKKVVSNMKLSGHFKKEGRSLNFLTTIDENYFYRFLNWVAPKNNTPMYKTINFDS